MKNALLLLLTVCAPLAWGAPQVRMETNHGVIVVDLAAKQAPQTVKNFLRYVEDGSYNGSVFHRVINNFVVQGGGYNQQFQQLSMYSPIVNESRGGLSNKRGTIAMARMQPEDSATRQFYFNLVDNLNLDANGNMAGYTVFGQVVEGMEVLDQMARVKTDYSPIVRARDVPSSPLILKTVTVLSAATPSSVKSTSAAVKK